MEKLGMVRREDLDFTDPAFGAELIELRIAGFFDDFLKTEVVVEKIDATLGTH